MPALQIEQALLRLREHPEMRMLASAKPIETAPVGYLNQPNFMNTVCVIETGLSPENLLSALLDMERQMGRIRTPGETNRPRTIDLDLLFYENVVTDSDTLTLPHPRLYQREFVLRPLAELAAQPELAWLKSLLMQPATL